MKVSTIGGALALSATLLANGMAQAACNPANLAGSWRAIFESNTSTAHFAGACQATVAANGAVSGSCKVYVPGNAQVQSPVLGGNIKASAQCGLSGTLTFKNGANPAVTFTVQAGAVSGTDGAMLATTPAPYEQVRTFRMLKL